MSKFDDYMKDIQGMERISLVLDLLVDKKITKSEAVVLIANDKQIKDKPDYNWSGIVNSGTGIATTPYSYRTTTGTTGSNSI